MNNFIPVASDFISSTEIDSIIQQNQFYLDRLECKRISPDKLKFTSPLYYFVVTGGTEQQILILHAERKNKFPNEEIILLAHPGNNSLPACLEVLARFIQEGKKGKIIYLPDLKIPFKESQKINIQKITDSKTLKSCRIGLVGEPSDWLVASSPSPQIVKKQWGADVIPIKLDELKKQISSIEPEDTTIIKSDLIEKADRIIEPSDKEIADNVRVYLAMKKLVKKYQLDAVTLRCFNLILDLKTTGCFALSKLNDEGIIAGCEGDLVSTLGMLWTYRKTGRIPWMANPARINRNENKLWLAHCTVPRCLVNSYKLRSHFESGLGVGIQGVFPKGKVTLLRIGGKNLDRIWRAEGEIVQIGREENLCRTQVKIKLSENADVQDILINPLGNHLVMLEGKKLI
ncbi:MAG: fucose isomerase [Candidatus Cloacimonetes bacterium]|nr:fucose isomerase [Candidatus Cloacimonadota bacterium]MBL7148940.1 fucose isomerase [Candidatus Cloacimonadota bacterium]